MSTAPEFTVTNGTTTGPKIALIIGSVRGVRIGPAIAQWIKTLFEAQPITSSPPSPARTPTIDLIDLKEINLPIFNEAVIPAMVPTYAQFSFEHSKEWSALIEGYQAYIILSPEYNRGTPGALKNAIDYLYNDWINKPVLVITYGIFGGSTASEQLKTTFETMHLDVVETRPKLEFPGRTDAKNGTMTPALGKAMAGEWDEEVKKAWEGKEKVELEKGFKELVEKLQQLGAAPDLDQ